MKKVIRELLEKIANIQTEDDYEEVYGKIGILFSNEEKITYKDYELLFSLLSKIGRYEGWNI